MKPCHGSIRRDARIQGAVPILLVNFAVLTLLTPLFAWDRSSRRNDAIVRWKQPYGVAPWILPSDPADDDRVFRPPHNGFVCPRADSRGNEFTVEILWDPVKQAPTYRVRRTRYTLEELRGYLFPIARSRIDPRTKFSKIPVCVRARNAPFGEVRKVLDVCADVDIQIHKVHLALADPAR